MRAGSSMTSPAALTPTDLIAASSSILAAAGYQAVDDAEWNTATTRLYEDVYGIVGMAVFSTCSELLRSWPDLQASLVGVMSQKVGRAESKAWDGYLVLLTPGVAPSDDLEIEDIRYDTTRLRKLIATGEDLMTAGDVEQLLRPLLPLRFEQGALSSRSALDLIPGILADKGIDREIAADVVRSFVDRKPLIETIHRHRAKR